MAYFGSSAAMNRLLKALNAPPMTTGITIEFSAQELATVTITKLLTAEEIEELSEFFETENLEAEPTGTTTYSLVPKGECN